MIGEGKGKGKKNIAAPEMPGGIVPLRGRKGRWCLRRCRPLA